MVTDHTRIAGMPGKSSVGLFRGEVVAERFEIRDPLRHDAFSRSYLAFDQENEATVLLRTVHPELLESEARVDVTRKLQEVVGFEGRFLSGLIDADRDDKYVFVVESLPNGSSYREILNHRVKVSRRVKPEEYLPVLSRIDAALQAVPPPFRHGDLRAENIWVEPERLKVGGAFLVSCLPEGVVAAVLQSDQRLRAYFAPEVVRGVSDDAADRYSIAVLSHLSLTGRMPPEPGEAVSSNLGAVGDALQGLLNPDPKRRTPSLEPLLEALARQAGLPNPNHDAGAVRRTRRTRPGSYRPPPRVDPTDESSDNEPTRVGPPPQAALSFSSAITVDGDLVTSAPPLMVQKPAEVDETRQVRAIKLRDIVGAAEGGTQEIRVEDMVAMQEDPKDRELTQPRVRESDLTNPHSVNPLLRVVKAEKLGIDPRFVRAALSDGTPAASLDSNSGESLESIELIEDSDPAIPVAEKRAFLETSEHDAAHLEVHADTEIDPRLGSDALQEHDPTPAYQAPIAQGTQELDEHDIEAVQSEVLRGTPVQPSPMEQQQQQQLRNEPLVQVAMQPVSERPTQTPDKRIRQLRVRPLDAQPQNAGSNSMSWWIIGLALLLGILMIVGALVYSNRQSEKEERQKHQQQIINSLPND